MLRAGAVGRGVPTLFDGDRQGRLPVEVPVPTTFRIENPVVVTIARVVTTLLDHAHAVTVLPRWLVIAVVDKLHLNLPPVGQIRDLLAVVRLVPARHDAALGALVAVLRLILGSPQCLVGPKILRTLDPVSARGRANKKPSRRPLKQG